jgi:hypothetical protein
METIVKIPDPNILRIGDEKESAPVSARQTNPASPYFFR